MKTKMKKYGAILSLILLATTTSACAGDDSKKDDKAPITADGNCSSETVSTYQDIGHKAQMYDLNHQREYLVGVQKACDSLQSMIGIRSCKAIDTRSNNVVEISYNDVKTTCEQANNLLKQ